jgi:16S rRNA (guanine527-N7)-methyltransferase
MEINVNKFIDLLLAENQKQNLISRKTGPHEIGEHIKDSLVLLQYMSLDNSSIVDIGSGAGFPGLILAMRCPAARFTLIESDLKKSAFLQEAIAALKMDNVEVLRERVEVLGQKQDCRSRFDLCTSRAVAAVNIMLEYSLPLLKVGGRAVLWKGRNYLQEMDQAARALRLLGGEMESIYNYSLKDEKDRALLVIRKAAATDEKYPRRTGIPVKRPL